MSITSAKSYQVCYGPYISSSATTEERHELVGEALELIEPWDERWPSHMTVTGTVRNVGTWERDVPTYRRTDVPTYQRTRCIS
jgi:hypothetical protein